MAPESARLAVDLSGSGIRVLEGAMGGPMLCASAAVPDGGLRAGRVGDPQALAQALRQILLRNEISQTRALVAVSDATATFRVLELVGGANDQQVGAAVARQLPLDPARFASSWVDINRGPDRRLVYAAAWDRKALSNVVDTIKTAGLEPVVVELKSAAMARAVAERSCVVLDLVAAPAEIVLIDDGVPWQWHAVDLSGVAIEAIPSALAPSLRSVIRFHLRKRPVSFGPESPVMVAAEEGLPATTLVQLADLVGHPVREVNRPGRVSADIRHASYLTCLGLLMRRAP